MEQNPIKVRRKILDDLLSLLDRMISENEAWRNAFLAPKEKETVSV